MSSPQGGSPGPAAAVEPGRVEPGRIEPARIETVRGRAVPVRGDDIDTDRIIPARFLRCVTFEGIEAHAFADDRKALAGAHAFDRPCFRGAQILLVNSNFGCGSSREHAPQSLMRWGIRGIVGESFAEIFFGNCVALGLPCLTLPRRDIETLQAAVDATPGLEVTLDLSSARVAAGESTYVGSISAGARDSFLSGTWDATSLLLARPDEIRAVARALPYMQGFSATA